MRPKNVLPMPAVMAPGHPDDGQGHRREYIRHDAQRCRCEVGRWNQAIRTQPGSPSAPSQVISRFRNCRITAMLVNKCDVTSETVNTDGPSAKARGRTS